jgi:hypothetical protein
VELFKALSDQRMQTNEFSSEKMKNRPDANSDDVSAVTNRTGI